MHQRPENKSLEGSFVERVLTATLGTKDAIPRFIKAISKVLILDKIEVENLMSKANSDNVDALRHLCQTLNERALSLASPLKAVLYIHVTTSSIVRKYLHLSEAASVLGTDHS